MRPLIEIEDEVLTTIRCLLGLELVGLDIYLGESGWEGKVLVNGRAAR